MPNSYSGAKLILVEVRRSCLEKKWGGDTTALDYYDVTVEQSVPANKNTFQNVSRTLV